MNTALSEKKDTAKKQSIATGIKKLWDSIITKVSRQSHTTAQKLDDRGDSLSIEREVIKDTPFTLVGTPKHGYWLTLGKHRISQPFKTKKEAIKHLDRKDWTLITAIIIAFIYDRKLVDQAYSRDTSIPPEDKSRQMSMDLDDRQNRPYDAMG